MKFMELLKFNKKCHKVLNILTDFCVLEEKNYLNNNYKIFLLPFFIFE